MNVPLPYTAAYASYGIRCVIGSRIPNNAGSLSAIQVRAPAGCILNAEAPRSGIGARYDGSHDPRSGVGLPARGRHRTSAGRELLLYLGPDVIRRFGRLGICAGKRLRGRHGSAGRPRRGLSVTGFPSGVRCTPVEVVESRSPIIVYRKELRQDSGGAGRQRGGLGQTMEFGHISGEPFTLSAMFQRVANPAAGRVGGAPGAAGDLHTNQGRPLLGNSRQPINAGETLILNIPGGGGFGRAHERAESAVVEDVADGLVSRAAAASDYGVALLDNGEIDRATTSRLRASPDRV